MRLNYNNMFKKPQIIILLLFAFVLLGGVGCIKIDFSGGGGGSDGGVFKAVDKGVEWVQKGKILTTGERVRSIANVDVLTLTVDPQDNNAIYMGSYGQGLFYSYDGGEGWNQAPRLQQGNVLSIAVSPKSKCVIFAAYQNKVIESTDCSRTFQVAYFESRSGVQITYVAVDPNNASVVYAGSSDGNILKSGDAGKSWMSVGRLGDSIKKILINPKNSAILYVATARHGIYRSRNAGGSWEELAENFKDYKDARKYQDLQFDLTKNDSLVYASIYGLLRTDDGGKTWEPIELLTPPGSATIYALGVNPRNGNDIFYSTATTFYRTLDGGNRWITEKLPTSRAGSAILIDPENPNVMYLGVRRLGK